MNRLPEVKKFLKEPGQADSYENLSVKFIRGRTPTLNIIDEEKGTVIESIDLSKYKTQELHELVKQKGFVKKDATAAAKSLRGEGSV